MINASYLRIVPVMKATLMPIFLFLLILAGHAKSEQWKLSDQSQVAEDASPGLSSFLEHVLKAQDEINWVKQVLQHEKGSTKEQSLPCNSQPFPSADDFEITDSDSEYQLNSPAQNLEEKEWRLGSSGKNSALNFMYDSSQNQLKNKNTGERFKRRSSDQLYKDPALEEIVRNNIENLHMLNFSPEQDTDIHMIAETSMTSIDTKDDTSIERRGTGKTDSSEEASLENEEQKEDPSDSVVEAYFAVHGRRQASRRQSLPAAHSRDVRVDVPDPLSETDQLKTMNERSEQEHQRLQLEDADGLLKGTRVDTHIGSVDNQMVLDKEKITKQTNKVKFKTEPIKESKISSRDSQNQDRGLPQQIKLDLLNDPLYNKVDLKAASQNVNIRNDKSEKSLIASLGAGNSALDNHLLSSVHQYLAGFDQQREESPNREKLEVEGAQIFLNKKDTSGQQVKWDESAVTPQSLLPAKGNTYQIVADKDSDSSVLFDADSNILSKDKTLLHLTRSNHEIPEDSSHSVSEHSTSKMRNQLMSTDLGLLQSNRDKRTVVKRPGAIWRESAGNEDLEEEPDTESEGKGVISFESEETDVNGKMCRTGNGGQSKSIIEDEDSSVSEAEDTIEEANDKESDQKGDKTNNGSLDQEFDSDNSHLDDTARLKASFKFSPKYAPVLEQNCVQEAEDKTSDSNEKHLVRIERTIKKTRQGIETGKLSKQKKNDGLVGKTNCGGLCNKRKADNYHLDDATRLKASFKFSSKFALPLEANSIQEAKDFQEIFLSDNSHPARNERGIKKSFRNTQADGQAGDTGNCATDEEQLPEREPAVFYDDVIEDSKNSYMHRKQRENVLSMGKSHSSRTLLCLFEAPNIIHNLDNEVALSLPNQKLDRSKNEEKEEKEEGKYLAEPLSMVIDQELISGNLPPLIRVKRSRADADFVSAHDKNSNELVSEIVDEKQSVLNEKPVKQVDDDWESARVSEKWSVVDNELSKRHASDLDSDHGNAKRLAVEPSANNMAVRNANVDLAFVDVQPNKQGSSDQKSVHENMRPSIDNAYLDEELASNVDGDQEGVFENVWSSGLARNKRSQVHSKRNHGRVKGQTARDAGGKGAEKFSRDMKSEWKINIRSTKHARRNHEDEDEKEYESADMNMCPGNVTKRASGPSDARELDSGGGEASENGVVSLNLPINGLVDETEDENEYESSQVENDKDYDVVRRHVRHSFAKRHPASKYVIGNIGGKGTSAETKVDDESTKNVEKYRNQEEEMERRPDEIPSEERYKRASNYDCADTGKVKSDSLSIPDLSNTGMGNIKLMRTRKSLFSSDLKFPYEKANELESHPIDLNPLIIPDSKMINERSPDSTKGNVKLPGCSKDKAVQGSAFPSSDLHEIHEMHLAGTKLSDSPAFGIDPKNNVLYSNRNFKDMTLLAPTANKHAPELHVRCAEKCTASPARPNASGVLTANPSCSTNCLAPSSQPRVERRVDRRRGTINKPKPGQSKQSASSEYKGELDSGQLGVEIVQAIFHQVDQTPCLKQSFGSGLSLRYHPTEIKETKENNCHSQQMMHEIMQLFDRSVDEQVKSRCSSLPSDLEEFITWLMMNETQTVSSTENPFLFDSHCSKAPAPRHLEEPKAEDIQQQISLRNKLLCEYNKLDKCDQDEVKPIYNYLLEQKNFLTTLLQKSKPTSGCDKKTECSKKPGCDSDSEQQQLVEETMDSVGLGPKAMHSSNIGDKFISGMSMVDGSAERLNDANGASLARRSVPKDGRVGLQESFYDQPHFSNARDDDAYSHRVQRDAYDESLHKEYPQNSHHSSNGGRYYDVLSDDDYEAADYNDGDANDDGEVANDNDLKRSLKHSSHFNDQANKQKKSCFFPSQKYKRLVALASELKRKKRNTLRRKKPHG